MCPGLSAHLPLGPRKIISIFCRKLVLRTPLGKAGFAQKKFVDANLAMAHYRDCRAKKPTMPLVVCASICPKGFQTKRVDKAKARSESEVSRNANAKLAV